MKILFVVRSLGVGGATKQLAITANALAEKGHCVLVYSYSWINRYDALSNKVRFLPGNKTKFKIGEYLCAVRGIRKMVLNEKPDVVISWRTNAGCFTRLATLGLKTKIIFSERTDPYMENSPFLSFAKYMCQFSDGGVFQTQNAKNFYQKLASKSVVIHNPFEIKKLDIITPINERRKEIVCVGRFFLRQKRQDILLRAFSIVYRELPDYKLVFCGDGDDINKVRMLAEELGIADRVLFKGVVNNVVEYIKNSSLLVLSSDYEGIPNVILEAFVAGTPVLSTDCSPGGAKVLISNGVNGYIVPRGDINGMAEKIIKIITNHNLTLCFIHAGRVKLADFNHKRIIEQWDSYLTKIVYNEK